LTSSTSFKKKFSFWPSAKNFVLSVIRARVSAMGNPSNKKKNKTF